MVTLALAGAAHRHGVYCPGCMPSRQGNGNGREWTKATYANYLQSTHWLEFKAQALRHYGHKCYLCDATGVQIDIHHNTYERLGGELISDVIPLCRDCHQGYEERKKAREL